MSNKLYVGSLAYSVTKEELQAFFGQYGEVADAVVIMDRPTGRSKGFGFVTFKDEQGSEAALAGANGQEIGGRAIKVSKANEDGGGRRTGGGGGAGGGGFNRGGAGGGFRGPRSDSRGGSGGGGFERRERSDSRW